MVSLSEADKAWKDGLKALKTGIFKWKPDVNGASIHFERAAKGFQLAHKWPEAIQAYQKLCECNEKLHDMWAAGRGYEQLASLAIQTDDYNACMQHVQKAAECFRIYGSNDKALNMYADMGRQFASLQMSELACKLFIYAIKLIQDEKMYLQAKDIVSSYGTVLLENSLYRDAQALYEKELIFAKGLERDHYIAKACLCIIGVVLISNQEESRFSLADDKSRELCLEEPAFVRSTEFEVFSEMSDAWATGDQERYDRAVRRASWTNVEIPLTRAVRQIQVPTGNTMPQVDIEEGEDVADFLR